MLIGCERCLHRLDLGVLSDNTSEESVVSSIISDPPQNNNKQVKLGIITASFHRERNILLR